MDEEHCAIAVISLKLRSSTEPQINAVTTSFLYVLPPLPQPLARQKSRRSFGQNDGAKLLFFLQNKRPILINNSQNAIKTFCNR